MPAPEWKNEHGITVPLHAVNSRTVKGERIAGAVISAFTTGDNHASLHEWERGFYQLAYRVFRLVKKLVLFITEKRPGLRMQAVLSGELHIQEADGKKHRLVSGQYHFTSASRYRLLFKKKGECRYFVSHYPDELLREFGIAKEMISSEPRTIPAAMLDIFHELLHNPYSPALHEFYYQNMLRDLFFIHLRTPATVLTGSLSEDDIAAVYRAEAKLSEDISHHYSIPELAHLAGTNEYKLKKGFQEIFKVGLFGRLIDQRMKRAVLLLETTNQPIKEIAIETGYGSTYAFIRAFSKRYNMITPQEWRELKKKEG